MAGKLIKKGAVVSKPAPKPASKPAPAGGGCIKKAVAAKVASRPQTQTDARTAWRKLFGG